MQVSLKEIWQLLKQAGKGFLKDKVPKLSASLAYYTIFSIGPMLIVIIYLAQVLLGYEAIEGSIYGQVSELVGRKAATQIQEIIRNAAVSEKSSVTAIIGVAALVIGATTVFAEIQDSINSIWKLKAKAGRGWVRMLLTRLLSFSLVVSLGFLMLVSLLVNGLIEGLMDRLRVIFPDTTVILVFIINILVSLLIIGFLFAIIFKVLPDAVIRWKDVAVGAIFTSILFIAGRFGISIYIGKSDIGSTYGTAGSIVVLLLWVYYSAIILYFGAEFTKVYAMKFGAEIRPNQYAVLIKTVHVESGKKTVQENEKEGEVIRNRS